MFGGGNDNAWWSGIQDMLFLLYHQLNLNERIISSDVWLRMLIYDNDNDDDFNFIPKIWSTTIKC